MPESPARLRFDDWAGSVSSGARSEDSGQLWLRGRVTAFVGQAADSGPHLTPAEVASALAQARAAGPETVDRLLATWGGHWALVHDTADGVILAVDAIRSFPIFYRVDGAPPDAAADVLELADPLTAQVNEDAAREFAMAAFVTGPDTLYAGVRQVECGTSVLLSRHGQGPTIRAYRRTVHSGDSAMSGQDAAARFSASWHAALDRTLARRRPGQQIVVPLSGGLDSRLLLARLIELDVPDVLAFTYGRPGTREVRISHDVAAALGVPWTMAGYEASHIRGAWAQPDAADYIRYAFAGASLPHVQDWYALRELTASGSIKPGALVLPGHTVVGNVHDVPLIRAPEPVGSEQMCSALIRHHHALRGNPGTAVADPYIRGKVDRFLELMAYDPGWVLSRADAIEYFNVVERQAKYINNSVRAYEFFGLDWELPMLDLPMQLLWQELPLHLTQDRAWYATYVDQEFARVTGGSLGYFEPTTLAPTTVARAKSALQRVRLATFAERLLSVRTGLHHPLVLEAFASGWSTPRLALRLMRAPDTIGVMAEQLLDGTWTPGGQLLARAGGRRA